MTSSRPILLCLVPASVAAARGTGQAEKVAVRTTGISRGVCAGLSEIYFHRIRGASKFKGTSLTRSFNLHTFLLAGTDVGNPDAGILFQLERAMLGKLSKYGLIAGVGVGVILGSSAVDQVWKRVTGAPGLIPVEGVPDAGESCYRPVSEETTRLSRPDQNLFSDFGEPGFEAQDGSPRFHLLRIGTTNGQLP
jgi:hypothetical protein